MKRFLPVFIIAILIISALYYLRLNYLLEKQRSAELELIHINKIHGELYRESNGYWDADFQLEKFQIKEILENQISSSTGIVVNWNKPEEEFNHFLITISEAKKEWTRTESGEKERTSLSLRELQPDTGYVVALRACYDPGCKAWMIATEEIHARTDKQYWRVSEEELDDAYVSVENIDNVLGTAYSRVINENLFITRFEVLEVFEQKLSKQKKARIAFTDSTNETRVEKIIELLNP